MQVQLKNNIFTATQWLKDGDHPAVKHCTIPEYTRDHYRIYRTVHDEFGYDGEETYNEINPGDWIVEMFDGIHLYSDEEFNNLFINPDKNSFDLDPEQDRLPGEQCSKCYSYDATECTCDEWGKTVDICGWCELYDSAEDYK